MEEKFNCITISSTEIEEAETVFQNFIDIVDNPKKWKKRSQLLELLKSDPKFVYMAKDWLIHVYVQNDVLMLGKILILLELSVVTREPIKICFDVFLKYIDHVLELILDQERSSQLFTNLESFNGYAALAAKSCLQTVQFLSEEIKKSVMERPKSIVTLESIFERLLAAICDKRFTKEFCLLAGTAFALLFDVLQSEASGDISEKIYKFVQMLGHDLEEEKDKQIKISPITISFPQVITSPFAQHSLINGLVNSASDLLFMSVKNGDILIHAIFQLLLVSIQSNLDATSKYAAFQTLFNWINCISNGISKTSINFENEKLRHLLQHHSNSLFLRKDSVYMEPLLSIVWLHVEDLVDGVPHFVRNIFAAMLKLHKDEMEMQKINNDKFYFELTKDLSAHAWHAKGRWIILVVLIPYIGHAKLFEIYPAIAKDLCLCMKTCSLPSIANEVYQRILKDINTVFTRKSAYARKSAFLDLLDTVLLHETWMKELGRDVLTSLQTDNVLLRQNIGLYWLPSTLHILPSTLKIIESEVTKEFSYNDVDVFHAYILVLKCARNAGLIMSDAMMKKKSLLENALCHSNVEIRAEALHILCNYPKKTEPFSVPFQDLILKFVAANLNCDSSKFRQQIFSSLKRLLLNVRDSCVVLHRKILKIKKGCAESVDMLSSLIDFVDNILIMSKSCLTPAASFQRKKTGLLLLQLLSDLYVFVANPKYRRKGAATETALPLFNYVAENTTTKWNMHEVDTELLSCLEDQHDEIRNLALHILMYHQNIFKENQLLRKEVFDNYMKTTLKLLNSLKFHEAESGSVMITFLMNRLINDEITASHFIDFVPSECSTLDYTQTAPLLLCNFILHMAKESFAVARDDLLKASSSRPIYGFSLALSVCLKSLANITLQKKTFLVFLKELLQYLHIVSLTMVQLFAGVHNKAVTNMDTVSPSFADIDEALDQTIKSCDSYPALKFSVGHVHCREIFMSFCWLNLKSLSFVITEIGHLLTVKENQFAILNFLDLELIVNFYKNTLIKCRHKGVIESSYTSLSQFAKSAAVIPDYWKYVSKCCVEVMLSTTDMKKQSSVTKRSAGIPMFIQSIVSAESVLNSTELLNACVTHLFTVARSDLLTDTKDINTTYDLPQFNAINILRAVFRDTSLGNAVLRHVEDAIMLTIDGFSSQSWSIRNASTTLLGALVPRILGQRLNQEESSQQNASTVDAFFHRYPKLEKYFLNCLREQSKHMKESGCVATLSHAVPVLTFLSKLCAGEKRSSVSEAYLPVLHSMTNSAVFVIRDLVASSLLAFTPEKCYESLHEDILKELLIEISPNSIHTLYLLLYKMVENMKDQSMSILISNELLKCKSVENHLFVQSLIIDILVEQYTVLDTVETLSLLHAQIQKSMLVLKNMTNIALGKLYLAKAVAEAVLVVLINMEDETLMNLLFEIDSLDLHTWFFDFLRQSVSKVKPVHLPYIFTFSIQIIMTCKNKKLLEAVLKYLVSMKPERSLFETTAYKELYYNLQDLPNIFPGMWPVVLPNLSMVVSYILEKNEKASIVDITSFCDKMAEFSDPKSCEDLRLGVALSLGILKPLLALTNNKEYYTAPLLSLMTASLQLLQDEDVTIRQEANASLNFINQLNGTNYSTTVQCNLTLENLFAVLTKKKHSCYMKWLLHVIIGQDVETNEMSDLMLFEQESANLYQEEIVVIDLALKYWMVTRDFSDLSCSCEDLNEMIEQVTKSCHMILSMLQRYETTCITSLERSIYGLFGSRKNYIRLYRLLKLLLLLADLQATTDSTIGMTEFTVFLEKIIHKYKLAPTLKSLAELYIQKNDGNRKSF